MVRAHVQSDRALVASKPRRRGEFESPVGSATSHVTEPGQRLIPTKGGCVTLLNPAKGGRKHPRSILLVAFESHRVKPLVPTAAPVPAAPVSERPPGKRRGENE